MSIRYRSGSKPALFFWWCSSALSPAAFFGRDSARNRPARSVHPGACNGTHPLLAGSGNRSDRAGGGKLGITESTDSLTLLDSGLGRTKSEPGDSFLLRLGYGATSKVLQP